MPKYDEDLDYLTIKVDISKEECEKIIATADKIITGAKSLPEKRIEAYLKKTQCLQKLGKFDESREFVEKMLNFNPKMPEALSRLGYIYYLGEDLDKALEYVNEAIKIKKGYAYAYIIKGRCYNKKGNYSEAIQNFSTAIRYNPNYALAYNFRGWAFNWSDEYDKAIKDFNKVIKLKPQDADSYEGIGYAYLFKDDAENAIRYVTEGINLGSYGWVCYWIRSKAFERISEDKKALDDINKILELEKKDPVIIKRYTSKKYDLLNKINDKWEPTRTRFVLYLDIMGFKNFVLRSRHDEVFEKLTLLMREAKLQEDKDRYFVYVVSFSDSIIIFSRDDTYDSLRAVIALGKSLMTKAMQQAIPIKGAISHGYISTDKTNQIFCGQPIIDAFLFQEEHLHYYGVTFLHSFEKFIYGSPRLFSEINKEDNIINTIVEIDTPIKKGGFVTHLNLNWFANLKGNEFNEIISKIKTTAGADGDIRKYIDNTIGVYKKLYPENKVSGFIQKMKALELENRENEIILDIIKTLEEAHYKTWNNVSIKDNNLPFISITFADESCGDDDNILLIGGVFAPDKYDKDVTAQLIARLNTIAGEIHALIEETLEGIKIFIDKVIVSKEIIKIDDKDILDKLEESKIVFANLDGKDSNCLKKIIPKSIFTDNHPTKEGFDSYSKYVERIIEYFEPYNENEESKSSP